MRIAIETETTATTEIEPRDEHAGQDVAEIAAVLADMGEQGHAGSGDQESAGEGAADAVLADDVAGRVGADFAESASGMKASPVESGPSRGRSGGKAS